MGSREQGSSLSAHWRLSGKSSQRRGPCHATVPGASALDASAVATADSMRSISARVAGRSIASKRSACVRACMSITAALGSASRERLLLPCAGSLTFTFTP